MAKKDYECKKCGRPFRANEEEKAPQCPYCASKEEKAKPEKPVTIPSCGTRRGFT